MERGTERIAPWWKTTAHLVGGRPHRVLVPQIGLHEPNFGNAREVLEATVGQVIERHDVVPAGRSCNFIREHTAADGFIGR